MAGAGSFEIGLALPRSCRRGPRAWRAAPTHQTDQFARVTWELGTHSSRDRRAEHEAADQHVVEHQPEAVDDGEESDLLDLIDDDKKRRTVYPHKETAKVFVKNSDPSKLTMIIHDDNNPRNNKADNLKWVSPSDHMKWQFEVGNKNNFKVWKTRKKRYKNGFKPGTVLPGRPRKDKAEKK